MENEYNKPDGSIRVYLPVFAVFAAINLLLALAALLGYLTTLNPVALYAELVTSLACVAAIMLPSERLFRVSALAFLVASFASYFV